MGTGTIIKSALEGDLLFSSQVITFKNKDLEEMTNSKLETTNQPTTQTQKNTQTKKQTHGLIYLNPICESKTNIQKNQKKNLGEASPSHIAT